LKNKKQKIKFVDEDTHKKARYILGGCEKCKNSKICKNTPTATHKFLTFEIKLGRGSVPSAQT
jgi:hypothetical protein